MNLPRAVVSFTTCSIDATPTTIQGVAVRSDLVVGLWLPTDLMVQPGHHHIEQRFTIYLTPFYTFLYSTNIIELMRAVWE